MEAEEIGFDRDDTYQVFFIKAQTRRNDKPAPKTIVIKYQYQFKEDQDKINLSEGNVLHVLAKESSDWLPSRLESFLNWFLGIYPSFLYAKISDSEYFPLHLALKNDNVPFLKAVLSHQMLAAQKHLDQVLKQTWKGRTYAQLAISGRSQLLPEFMSRYVNFPQFWDRGSNNENHTPLHVAVSEVHDLDKSLRNRVKEITTTVQYAKNPAQRRAFIANLDGKLTTLQRSETGPYNGMNGEAKDGERDARRKTVILFLEEIQQKVKENGEYENSEAAKILLELNKDTLPSPSIERISKLLLEFINSHNNAGQSGMSQVKVVEELIKICKEALFVASSSNTKILRTPYQHRIFELRIVWNMLVRLFSPYIPQHTTVSKELEEDAFRSVVIGDPIASTIRSYCLHNFTRDEITKCLYHPGQELHIDFDLAGLPSPTISKAFLDRLLKHLRFESILKYVALPRLAIEPSSAAVGSADSTRARHRGQKGRVDLKQIFQWLRDRKVKSIIKVIVIEDGTRPHTDTAIEEAVRGFNVEMWDWKKPDLCTDVIANSSSVVKQISLYSSGNNAVLMGWASSFGLADQIKFPKLEHVNLFIREGQEGDERRKEHLKAFIERLHKKPNAEGNLIHVDYMLDDGEVSYAVNFKNSEGCLPSDNWWIKDLQEFALLNLQIQSLEKPTRIAPVKIAIVDDGVDGSLELLTGKIAGGKSFCPYPNSNDLMNAYYVPSGPHGTMMAHLICKVCPKAMLYIARLDERFSRDGGRHITASSAADMEHIGYKVGSDCDVDIISMSWTIETLQPDKDITKLGDAIQAAAAKHILMFCAASDQDSISSDHCYPGKWGQCIKIGAATDKGDKCAWVPENHYEFLFPGKNVPVSRPQVDGLTTSFESGSSLATALAAGLAGLLLFCDRAVHETETAALHDESEVEFLRKRENMTDVFKKMGTPRVFPRVDTWFKNTFQSMLNGSSGGGSNNVKLDISKVDWSPNTREALKKFMEKLKNKEG